MFSIKTSRDVEVIPPCSCMEKAISGQKGQKQGQSSYAMTLRQTRSTFASFKAHWIVFRHVPTYSNISS